MSCSCCAQFQAELMVSNMELSRAKIERDNAILAKDYAEERLTAARLDLANMANKTPAEHDPPCDGKCATDECVCRHKDTHADDGATASYEALIKALRNDLEKEHRQNVELLGALKQAAVLDTSSERDFRRALVAAIAGGVASDPECHEINEYWVCDTAKEIADEQLRRERGGK